MKNLIAILLILQALIIFSGQICSAETFTVMSYTDTFPPYSFKKEYSETGIVRDLLTALSKITGDTFKYKHVPFKRGQYEFDAGRIDIEPMCNPVWRKDSLEQGIYSIPFTTSDEIVLFNADKSFPIKSPKDFFGKTIGTVSGYHYPTFDSYFATGQIKSYPMENEKKLIKMLLAGRLDQALMNKDYALYQMKTQRLRDRLVVGKPCSIIDMMIRFHPDKESAVPRFNKALQKLLNDGTIENIYSKYR